MPGIASTTDDLCFNTVRLEAIDGDSGGTSLGTGFILSFNVAEGKLVSLLITNKHVVEGSTSVLVRLTRSIDGQPDIGRYELIDLGGMDQWIPHPDDSVDLCARPLGPIVSQQRDLNRPVHYRSVSETSLASSELIEHLSAFEDVLMVGYPVGLADEFNNMPIFRKGVTATRPDLDYDGRSEFLIDIACFPGSSGSPVYYVPSAVRVLEHGPNHVSTSQLALLGILYAGPQHTVEGEIRVDPIPTNSSSMVESRVPINLGVVIKAAQLMAFKPIVEKILRNNPCA
jgi:hypothetical protein